MPTASNEAWIAQLLRVATSTRPRVHNPTIRRARPADVPKQDVSFLGHRRVGRSAPGGHEHDALCVKKREESS
ncbi:hypothetical protein [Embleya sp. NPDC056538]|uniref:hypothetical protein n=1 Tax=Embleya sp. NPDC056538 TaxID=3345858 RepID=UPI00369B19AE